ncbi:MAG: glycosyltransferase family 4 protein [Anaerolineae bacterium]|nr:glycosyltransferase family 4 protein [Anaerolineae bacterium]
MVGKRLNILTWHVHGSYLNNLCQVEHNWYLPVRPGRPPGYGGRGATFDWPDWVVEVPADEVQGLDLDLILFQSIANYAEDQHEILSPRQRRLPRIYLEHNVPRPHAVSSLHPVDDPEVLIVHVTHYNRLMWNCGRSPTTVIEHGVRVPAGIRYTGELERGVVVVNGLQSRPRIAGHDLVLTVRERVPLDLIGMGTRDLGGLGEVAHTALHALEARYRFFWHPIRYTSLGLALLEAMMLGLPVLCFSVTEHPRVVQDGVTGFISNDVEELVDRMRLLLRDRALAAELGRNGQRVALERYNIDRFVRDWDLVLRATAAGRQASSTAAAESGR